MRKSLSNGHGLVEFAKCHLVETGASFDAGIDFKEWRWIGRFLCRVAGASQWWIGDWLVAGAQRFVPAGPGDGEREATELKEKRKAAHERYARAVELTGYDANTLKHFVCVARAFASWRRRHDISWGHHREVLALEDERTQDHYMAEAARNGWSVSQLRQAIRNELADGNGTGKEGGPTLDFAPARWANQFTRWIHVQVDPKAGGTPIEEWDAKRREALRRELKPIVDVHQALERTMDPVKESISSAFRNR
jgi:hypothetical protein